jgi:hypothetical protein
MRFHDAAPDGRAVVYSAIQGDPLVAAAADLLAASTTAERILARAVMNGQRTGPEPWRTMFPTCFGRAVPADRRGHAEALLAVSLEIAGRADQVRSQFRGAVVEALTARLLARRTEAVRSERRIMFDGQAAEIHPYDVTVETPGAAEVYDCKWGARGIDGTVLLQLDAARANAAAEGHDLLAAIVVFDAYRSCLVRLSRETAPARNIRLVTIETIGELARRPPVLPARR